LLLTGFQTSAYWKKETERYNKLTGWVNTVCIFATGELPFVNENTISISLLPEDELEREWFLIVVTAKFSVVLCARDQLLITEKETDRKFNVLLSFDPIHIVSALDILEKTISIRNPAKLPNFKIARTNFIPGTTQPYYFNLIFGQFMQHLDKYNEVLQQLSKERTIRTLVSSLLHETSQPVTALLLTLQMSQVTNQLPPEDINFMLQAVQSLHERILKLRQTLSQKEVPEPRSENNIGANEEDLLG
jgi:DICT domain-containing protein